MTPFADSLVPFLAWMPGWPEIVLILVLVLILFGPRKLPEVADAMGKSIRKFKAASREATDTVQKELDEARRAVDDEPSDRPKTTTQQKPASSETEGTPPRQDS